MVLKIQTAGFAMSLYDPAFANDPAALDREIHEVVEELKRLRLPTEADRTR